MYNERHQLKQRYTPFNVHALRDRIAEVCGSGVDAWNKKEGVFNKSFVATLRDGRQVAIRVKVRNFRSSAYLYMTLIRRIRLQGLPIIRQRAK